MSEKRRGLGRGIGALIPPGPATASSRPGRDRPVDVFFPNGPGGRVPDVPRGTTDGEPVDGTADPHATGGNPEDEASAGDGGRTTDVSRGTAGSDAPEPDRAGVEGVPAEDAQVTAPTGDQPAPAAVDPSGTLVDGGAVGQRDGQQEREQDGDDDQDTLLPVPGARFAELPVSAIRPNSRQPRQVFDQDAMDELVHSVREIGVLQPVVVRPLPEPDADGARFELIMGERRWRASTEAGLQVVPAIVRVTDDDVMLRDALLENLHRAELNPLEEAAAYQQLLDDFGCTQDELSRRIGRSRPQISNTIRLLRLPPAVQRRVAAGVLSAGHARALLSLDDSTAAERLAHRIVNEGLSVRAVEEIVSSRHGTAPRTSAPRAGRHLPLLDDVASRLSDRLDTRVKVALGKNRGRLTVEFATVEDLDRILAVLDPGGPGVARRDDPGAATADDPAVSVGAPEEHHSY